MKKAFITGVTGQDGSYLTEFLLARGYAVHGLVRRLSDANLEHLSVILKNPALPFRIHEASLTDSGRLTNLLREIAPGEVYNLAAQSDDEVSLGVPEYTADINGMGPLRLLESIAQSRIKARFFQASSSEMFGASKESPQNEATPLCPLSPYGLAKTFAHGMVDYYRKVRGLYAVSGILFNHESPRRGEAFVTRKITRGLAGILSKRQKKIRLGNLESRRDWGFAGDYVEAIWLSLQAKRPGDYVIATGESHSIKDFLREAFSLAGLDYRPFVQVDPRLRRAVDVKAMRGDSSKARKRLGWKPKVGFKELVRRMVEADLAAEGLSLPPGR
jgi:GDPmannose 4,6-dehydratase